MILIIMIFFLIFFLIFDITNELKQPFKNNDFYKYSINSWYYYNVELTESIDQFFKYAHFYRKLLSNEVEKFIAKQSYACMRVHT